MIDDERLVAMVRALEETSQRVHDAWTQATRMNPLLLQGLAKLEREIADSRFSDVARSYQRAMDQASTWLNQIQRATRQPASPSTITRRVEALQARAPDVQEALQAEIAKLKAELTASKAAQQATRPARQRGQQKAVAKRRKAAEKFVRQIDAEIAKSDETSLNAAIIRVLKDTGVRMRRGRSKKIQRWDYTNLTPLEREKALRSARGRYHDWQKKICTIR